MLFNNTSKVFSFLYYLRIELDELKKNKIKSEEEVKEEDLQRQKEFQINAITNTNTKTTSNTNSNDLLNNNFVFNSNNDIRIPSLTSNNQFQPIDTSIKFNTISNNDISKSNSMAISQQSLISKRSQPLIEEPKMINDQLYNLNDKVIKKKQKIKRLKQEIVGLKEQQVNNINQSDTKLLSRIKELEFDKKTLEQRIKELATTKSKEIQSMNETIKQFELIINENSSSNLSEINELRNQLNAYRSKLDDSNLYIKELLLFINRMNDLMNSKSIGEIKDIVDLKNKITEIENYIVLSNTNCVSFKEKYNKLLEINAKLIEGKGSPDDYYDFDEINSKRVHNNNNNSSNNDNNKLKVPQFQNKILEGLSNISGTMNNCFEDDVSTSNIDIMNSNSISKKQHLIKKDNANSQIYKTLEIRVNALERELNSKMNMGYDDNDSNSNRVTPMSKIKKCHSSSKISHRKHNDGQNNTQYQQSNNQSKLSFQRKNNNDNDNISATAIDLPSNKKKIKKVKTAKNKHPNIPKHHTIPNK